MVGCQLLTDSAHSTKESVEMTPVFVELFCGAAEESKHENDTHRCRCRPAGSHPVSVIVKRI